MAADSPALRPARVDDLMSAVRVGSTTFSPDGQVLAFTRTRPVLEAPLAIQSSFVQDPSQVALSDLWLHDGAGRPPRNLTNGGTDQTAAWLPVWSPDGARLAYLSTRGGGISLWVWERATNRVRKIATPGISVATFRAVPTVQWVDHNRILCLVEPDGVPARLETSVAQGARRPIEAWAKAARGEVTASVLDSTEFRHDQLRLWLVDVRPDARPGRQVGTSVEWGGRGHFYWLSPNKRTVAIVRPEPVAYGASSGERMGAPRPLRLTSLDDTAVQLDQPLPENVHTETLQWSPNGAELAFFANGPGPINPLVLYGTAAAATMPDRVASRANPAKLYRVDVETGRVTTWGTGEIDLGDLGAPDFFWTRTGELIVSAPRREYGITHSQPASRGSRRSAPSGNAVPIFDPPPSTWWVIARDGQTRRLGPDAASLPSALRPIAGGASFVGLRDGDVWLIDPTTSQARNLTESFAPRVASITSIVEASDNSLLVLQTTPPKRGEDASATDTSADADHVLDVTRGIMTQIAPPARDAKIVAVSQDAKTAAYLADNRNGTFLWRVSDGTGASELLVETNTFGREVLKPNCRRISYTSLNGEELNGRLCLPVGYVEGRRYPLVLNVYFNTNVSGSDPATESRPQLGDIYNAAGYAYLSPSIPASIRGVLPEEGDATFMTINAVIPAAEKVVSLGIADPQRLFIEGGSRGGWTVLSVIGQTTRFKAAVSTSYGEGARLGALDHGFVTRYSEAAMDFISPNGGVYKGYRPSDVPWWRDGDVMRRNHPLSYVDRVQTPVMLMHGDLDGIPLEQSEEYFYALVAMRKPAQFVRYWGEGHGNITPANVRDRFQRVFAWFDRWGDITRDSHGDLVFDGDRVKSRGAAPALTSEDFARIGPAAATVTAPPRAQ